MFYGNSSGVTARSSRSAREMRLRVTRGEPIRRAAALPGAARLRGLRAFNEKNISIPVTPENPWTAFESRGDATTSNYKCPARRFTREGNTEANGTR